MDAPRYVVDMQADLLSHLASRLVVPLWAADRFPSGLRLTHAMPDVSVAGDSFLFVAPELAAISASRLGPSVADLTLHRHVLRNAIDFMLAGY